MQSLDKIYINCFKNLNIVTTISYQDIILRAYNHYATRRENIQEWIIF
jgi:hypothetical protein